MERTESRSTTFVGGCAGDVIRQGYSSEPVLTFSCHCLDCQKAGGSAYASCLMAPAADFRLISEPNYYTVTADSGYPESTKIQLRVRPSYPQAGPSGGSQCDRSRRRRGESE